MHQIVGVPHQLAALSVNPLRVFAFFCFTGKGRREVTKGLEGYPRTQALFRARTEEMSLGTRLLEGWRRGPRDWKGGEVKEEEKRGAIVSIVLGK